MIIVYSTDEETRLSGLSSLSGSPHLEDSYTGIVSLQHLWLCMDKAFFCRQYESSLTLDV